MNAIFLIITATVFSVNTDSVHNWREVKNPVAIIRLDVFDYFDSLRCDTDLKKRRFKQSDNYAVLLDDLTTKRKELLSKEYFIEIVRKFGEYNIKRKVIPFIINEEYAGEVDKSYGQASRCELKGIWFPGLPIEIKLKYFGYVADYHRYLPIRCLENEAIQIENQECELILEFNLTGKIHTVETHTVLGGFIWIYPIARVNALEVRKDNLTVFRRSYK